MSTAPIESLPAAERRRLVVVGLLRASATTVMVVAAYYLLPLDNLAGISLGVALAVRWLLARCGSSSIRCGIAPNRNTALAGAFFQQRTCFHERRWSSWTG